MEEPLQLSFFVLIKLFFDESLGVHTVVHFFGELFKGGLEPVLVIFGGFDSFLIELVVDFAPDLAHFEMWVHLNDLHLLLLEGIQLIFAEPNSIQDAEHRHAQVAGAHNFLYPIH